MNRWLAVAGLGLGLAGTILAEGVVNQCDELALASALEGGGLVTFACDGTIKLSQPVVISADTVLDASGRQVTLSGGGMVRVLEVRPGANLRVVHLAVTDGRGPEGGGLLSQAATVTMVQCVFAGNVAQGAPGGTGQSAGEARGGALFASNGVLTVTRCVFTNNHAIGGTGAHGGPQGQGGGAAGGGAVYAMGGSLNASMSVFLSNSAMGGAGGTGVQGGAGGRAAGGAILISAAEAGLTEAALSGARARGGPGGSGTDEVGETGAGWGGGIHVESGTLRMSAATVWDCETSSGPAHPPRGGGLSNLGTLTAVNTTVAGNRTTGLAGGDSFGGGVYNEGTMTLEFCTLAANTGSGFSLAGGGNLHNARGVAALRGTVVAYSPVQWDVVGALEDRGFNLCWDSSAHFTDSTSLNSTDPKLGPLADNGGPVRTMLPLMDSPVLDAALPTGLPPADARGFPRPAGLRGDLGAVEGTASPPAFTLALAPPLMPTGRVAVLRVSVHNPNPFALRELSFVHDLPAGLAMAPQPAPTVGCDGTSLAEPSAARLGALFPVLGAQRSCSAEFPVLASVALAASVSVRTGHCANLGTFTGAAGSVRVQTVDSPTPITLPVVASPDGFFVLRGLVLPLGREVTAYFEWGADPLYGQRTP